MNGSMWGIVALAGLALVAAGNLLRFRRTNDRGCLGHLFVARDHLEPTEWSLNRAGIATFAVGVVAAVIV